MATILRRLNVLADCRAANLSIWSCPPFLLIIMGLVNVGAMMTSYLLANRFVAEPEVAALIVIAVSITIFIIGNFIIHGFTQIAEANRMKSEFIAIVSHQLRSPLSIFKWTLDAMGRNPKPADDPSSPDGPSYVEMLRENAEKMIQLVNMLLEVSRIEAGRLLLRREPVQLHLLTEEITRSYTAYARASNVSLEYAAPATLPPIRADREKLKMVMQNLIDNAIRYSRSGGRVIVTIAPAAGEKLEWSIRDTGPGIPKEEQRYIFQKFFRAPQAVKQKVEGSGLGLYIARSIIAALDGEIGFSSEEGKGSTFWFRLPTR